ncbi:hypothetical protein [Polynucleobacter sp. JS-JIR-5-A7]|uniref:hypothetical protein n=1 Tax=Polynucleobacter sp. JS-JIR-5-A7 TaxID=1758395 RepID=UPI001BFD604F|nr:hypothetical protein [Polynucleobacter sp. JS-JIR-5-A7]QWE06384.1 hypothetical protein AOC29_09805 [Polynucleobacter sp. JS-JIR-5-A7]
MKLSRMRNFLIPVSLGLIISTNVFGQSQSFRCNFSDGLSTNWDSGKPSSKRTSDMSELIFDQIDIKKGTGRMIGNSGSETVQVLKGDSSTHIVERTPSGNMNITTIFNPTQKYSDLYPVVHSRHINLMSGPFPSQYVGLCKNLK